jgi:hypothetical protein
MSIGAGTTLADSSAMGVIPLAELKPSLLHPRHPERTCWGCDLYCQADAMRCGNGTIRTPHPLELFGEDWDTSGASDGRQGEPDDC